MVSGVSRADGVGRCWMRESGAMVSGVSRAHGVGRESGAEGRALLDA